MVQTEGYAALMSGVSATVARGLFYGGGHLRPIPPYTAGQKAYLLRITLCSHPAFPKRGSAWAVVQCTKS